MGNRVLSVLRFGLNRTDIDFACRDLRLDTVLNAELRSSAWLVNFFGPTLVQIGVIWRDGRDSCRRSLSEFKVNYLP